jgi:hypothetical protein
MGRPTKPLSLVKGHRTKGEKEERAKAEAELLTGVSLKENDEVKNNFIAHKEFMRLKKLLRNIKMDDDLYSNMVNILCKLKAETNEYEEMKKSIPDEIKQLEMLKESNQIDILNYLDRKSDLQAKYMAIDKNIMAKRKMELDISKENIMTIQSALRSIPKKEQPKKESAMAKMLKQRAGADA